MYKRQEYNSDNDKNYRPERHNYEEEEDEDKARGRYEEIDLNKARFESSLGKDSLKHFKEDADAHDDDNGYYMPAEPKDEVEDPEGSRYKYGGGQAQRRSFDDIRLDFERQDKAEQEAAARVARSFLWKKH